MLPALFLLSFSLFSSRVSAATLITDFIFEDTTWTLAESPYIVDSPIMVAEGVSLTIEPGVIIKFNYDSFMFVQGKINALGTPEAPIYFTSIADDFMGGDSNNDGDASIPFIGDWGGIHFRDSSGSVFNSASFYFGRNTLMLENSSVNFKDLKLALSSDGLMAFRNSRLEIVGGTFDSIGMDAFVFFDHTAVVLKDFTINDIFDRYAVSAFLDSSVELTNVQILNSTDGALEIFNNSSTVFNNLHISDIFYNPIIVFNDSSFAGENMNIQNIFADHGDAITLFNGSDLSIQNSSFKDCPNGACVTFFDGGEYLDNPSNVNIENTVFDGGLGSGLLTFSAGNISATVKNSSFQNFDFYGVESYASFSVNATRNFWGHPSGPNHPNNPNGLGSAIFGNVLFDPWLGSYPPVSCCSSVLFLPGLMGSRLYKEVNSKDKELWVSTDDDDHVELALDNRGKSIDSAIYTKNDTQNSGEEETGIIDEVFGANIYNSFIDDLQKWKAKDKIIEDYAFIPYDWRLSLNDVITNGRTDGDDLSYNLAQDFSESFILKQLQALQANSRTGKVTIIAHSNGGLVAKALMQKLKDTSNPLYEKIDKLILVAVPQVGTPDAIAALLHGSELGPLGLLMTGARSRNLAENMSPIYNFLPSDSYFNTVDPAFAIDKVASFEDTPFFNPQTSQYGIFVSNQAELKNYILGTDGRTKPLFANTVHPNIGNYFLYNQAESLHQMLDSWQPSTNTKVIQVAGWGEETIAGIDYTTKRDILEHLSYKPRFVVDGDGTVVVPSALWMTEAEPNVERWWVDLARYDTLSNLERVHRDILEVSNLRNFIKSKITDSSFTDSENIILNNDSTLVSSRTRLHYTLHSPLTLGITDAQGRYTGQDPITKEIKQEIPGVTYRQIGEVQFLSVPADMAHTLKMQGYQTGYFALDLDKQTGNTIDEFTSFEGVPSSSSSIVTMDATSDMAVADAVLNLDQNGDGTVEKTLQATPNGTTFYDNTPPELQITFDAKTRDVVFSAQDAIDPNPTISITKTSITLTDSNGNTTIIPFLKLKERSTRLRFSYDKIIRNGVTTTVPSTNIVYEWKEPKRVLTDLDTRVTIKGLEKYFFNYKKSCDTTVIREKKGSKTSTVSKKGFVVVTVKTEGDGLKVDY